MRNLLYPLDLTILTVLGDDIVKSLQYNTLLCSFLLDYKYFYRTVFEGANFMSPIKVTSFLLLA